MGTVKDYINLLPREEEKPFPVMATAIALFMLAWLAIFGLQLKRAWELRKEQSSLSAKKQILQRDFAGLQKELGPTVFGMIQEKDIIHTLLVERVLWSEAFKHFSLIVPAGVWFDSLEGNSSGKTKIKITGGALNYVTLGQFMAALESSGYFMNPQLRYVRRTTLKGRDTVSYEITCETKKGDAQ